MADIVIRQAKREDMPRLLEIEKGSTPSLQYLAGVEDLFFNFDDGELVVAELDGTLAGFGRFSMQPDGACWLETLRVDPAMQKNNCGRMIWARFMELIDKFEATSVRMYTTYENEGSKKLAYEQKLDIAMRAREYSLMLDGIEADEVDLPCLTDATTADDALFPYLYDYKGYYITNRTWFAANPLTIEWLAAEGKVYGDESCAMTCGSRFLHSSAMHFGLMGGELDKCISFAINKGLEAGVPKVVTVVDENDEVRKAALEARGFKMSPSDIIMMERMM